MSTGSGALRCGLLSAALAGALCAPASHARAEDAPSTTYEAERLGSALRARNRQSEPRPEGKRIAFVEVARDEVFIEEDLLVPIVLPRSHPTWPNTFHWLTREHVVRRELLFSVGDAYTRERVEESERNLRDLAIFALVKIVAVRGAQPDEVGVLVYTRDLWSLRTETAFSGAGGSLRLQGQVVERNLFGLDKSITLRAGLAPKTLSVGELYIDARLLDSDLLLTESFDVILNRERGGIEGSVGTFTLGLPKRAQSQRYTWGLSASYQSQIARSLKGDTQLGVRRLPSGKGVPCIPGAPEAGATDESCARAVFEDDSRAISLGAAYHRGIHYSQSFGAGIGYSDREVNANDETMLLPSQRDTFERLVLPRVRRQIYPSLSYGLSLPDYVTFQNLGTFGQTESVRIGPEVTAGASLPLEAFGSSTNSVRFSSGLGYVLADGRALLEGAVTASSRLEQGRVVDQTLSGLVRGATPDWLFGRVIAYGAWTGRRNDTSNALISLGGDTGLRGYPSDAFIAVAANRLRLNVEYRTRPIVLASVHLGGVAFYDGGSVYTAFASAGYHQSVGAGLRVLFPQINRTPFSIDCGFPLEGGGVSVLLSYGSEQAVPLTAYDDALAAAGP